MPKKPSNHGKRWSDTEVKKLEKLAKGNTPTPLIGWKMHRTEDAIRSKAAEEKISLQPTNKSPYNRSR